MRRLAAIACIISSVWMTGAVLLYLSIGRSWILCLDDARWSGCNSLEFLAMCYFGYGILFLLPIPFFIHPLIRGRKGYPVRIVVPAILTTFLLVCCILTTMLLSQHSNPGSEISLTSVDTLILIGMLAFTLWSLQLGSWLISTAKSSAPINSEAAVEDASLHQ